MLFSDKLSLEYVSLSLFFYDSSLSIGSEVTAPFDTYPAGDDPRLQEETHGDRDEPHPDDLVLRPLSRTFHANVLPLTAKAFPALEPTCGVHVEREARVRLNVEDERERRRGWPAARSVGGRDTG